MDLKLDTPNISKLHNAYNRKRALVTGGASFIGSHLSDMLLTLGADVTVVDDMSSGRAENLDPAINLVVGDVRDIQMMDRACVNQDFVFHLAAVHGGRGFIDTQQAQMVTNFGIDTSVFTSAISHGVPRIVHASSACAYPINLQADEESGILLEESQANFQTPADSFPDGLYGWAKLIGEYQLANAVIGSTSTGRSARIFTAYGERENESHAAIALMAKALLRMDPYPIWGTGNQTRNFTYVADTVTGLLLLGSDNRPLEFDVFNIGTSEHIRVLDFVQEIFESLQWKPDEYTFELDKPTGVASRAADNRKIQRELNWEPSTTIQDGIRSTVVWYEHLDSRPTSVRDLEQLLMSR